ncbi:protein PRRC1 isoform X2 [Eurytemora carolleeae]|uniref:protein PRRC1 isoform X2 n=1 Tax=Eurytemora carolleeae TaxID=1294199 RepID=UPI000C777B7E|nr:protein PRRC1 isoform X2 [Eurytemora carolleeae]|eukprot:XP_023328122.1 protein PRRC1-like isoform X2 [Eurytemora affinis]
MVIFLKFWVVFIVSSFVSNPVAYIFNINRLLLRYYFRKCGSVQKDTVVVSVENFLYEASENLWLDFSCLVLSDPLRKIQLQSYSQPTNVTPEQIQILKDSTPSDYPKQWSGFAVPIGGVMAKELQVSPELWQEAVSGISRRRLLTLAGEGLAGMYKREIKLKVEVI